MFKQKEDFMKTLLSFCTLILLGCATTSEVKDLKDKADKTALRVEEVRLEQQAEFCVVVMVPCLLATQDRDGCSVEVSNCTNQAVEEYKKNTGRSQLPEPVGQLIRDIRQSLSNEDQPEKTPQQDDGGPQ